MLSWLIRRRTAGAALRWAGVLRQSLRASGLWLWRAIRANGSKCGGVGCPHQFEASYRPTPTATQQYRRQEAQTPPLADAMLHQRWHRGGTRSNSGGWPGIRSSGSPQVWQCDASHVRTASSAGCRNPACSFACIKSRSSRTGAGRVSSIVRAGIPSSPCRWDVPSGQGWTERGRIRCSELPRQKMRAPIARMRTMRHVAARVNRAARRLPASSGRC